MRSTRIMQFLTAGLLAFLSLPASWAQNQTKKDNASSAAIEQVITGFIGDFNRHDAHAMSSWFTEDGDYTNGGGVISHGRKGIEEHFITLFSGSLGSAQRTAVNMRSIRFLNPEVASVDIDYVLGGVKARDGSINPSRAGLYDCTLVKQNGHWLIAILHEIGIGSAPSPVSHP